MSTVPASASSSRTHETRRREGGRRWRRLIVGTAGALMLAGCDGRLVPPVAVTGIDLSDKHHFFDVDPGHLDLRVGASAQLVLRSDAAFLPATWVTENPGIATVTPTGLVRAFAPGTVIVTVTSTTVITRKRTVVIRVL